MKFVFFLYQIKGRNLTGPRANDLRPKGSGYAKGKVWYFTICHAAGKSRAVR